jgi:glycosyltransferase involved in cell wall biosynthesis
MTIGCPVVSSDAASLKEVGGDAVLYAAPDRPHEWLSHIAGLSTNQELRSSLVEKGRKQATLFSWTRSAGIYLDELLRMKDRRG